MSKKVKVEEIGVSENLPNTVVLKGTKKSALGKKDVYSSMVLQETSMEQLLSLMTNLPNRRNQFIKDILNLTGEEIKKLDIDIEPTGNGIPTSTLEISGEKLKPILPSEGINYALIGGADILLNKKVVVKRNQFGRKEFDNLLDSIDFKDVESLYDNVKGFGSVDFDKKGYDELEIYDYDTINISSVLSVTPFFVIPIYSNSIQFLIYKFDENTYYGFVLPEDTIFQKYMKQVQNKQINKYERSHMKDNRLRNLSIMSRILEKSGHKVNSVYVDGKPIQPLNENTILYKPEDSIIDLEKDGEIISLKGPNDLSIGLAAIYSDTLWLKRKEEKEENLSYIR